jgi:hypothetical protein
MNMANDMRLIRLLEEQRTLAGYHARYTSSIIDRLKHSDYVPDWTDDRHEYCKNKVKMINQLRAQSGWSLGLKEAKDIIEVWIDVCAWTRAEDEATTDEVIVLDDSSKYPSWDY